MTDGDGDRPLGRRELLAAVTMAAASGTAGCSVSFDDGGVNVDFGGGGAATSTGDGSDTPADDRTPADDDSPADDRTPADDGTPTGDGTDESTGTASNEDAAVYGQQGYGEGSYGGVAP